MPSIFTTYRARWSDRDNRMLVMTSVVDGTLLTSTTPDDEDQPNNSPNLIQVGIEDTAESAALMPTVRVVPAGPLIEQKRQATMMEKIGTSYLTQAGGHVFLIRCLMDLISYGFFCVTASLDKESGLPRIDVREAVGVYPEPGWRPGDSTRRCLFARSIYKSQLPQKYQDKLAMAEHDMVSILGQQQTQIILVEWYDEDEIVIGALYSKSIASLSPTQGEFMPVELERFQHGFQLCPVTLGQRVSLDHEPRGQFDQVVEPMLAHARLMTMAIDYADQAVYSDMWVKDPLGPIPLGGGGVIQLGPNGSIGRVQPAVTSLSLFNELDRLTDAIHLGGRWPKSRPGEIDQSIASAKFLESSVGMMNTAIRTYHEILTRSFGLVLNNAFKIDQSYGSETATAVGVLKNQEFVVQYDPKKDIDPKARVMIEYGLGLGRDPSQSAVLHIQYNQAGMISLETVQESIEGITDVDRERRRLDVEKLEGMLMAKLMQDVESGQIPTSVLFKIADARGQGKDLMAILKKYLVDPAEAAQASGIMSGIGGGLQQPGAPPGQPGGPPGAPPGPMPPTAPPPIQMMNQMSVPTGGRGNYASTRSQGPNG